MKYEDQKLMLEYARLQLRIAISRNPMAALDVTEATVHRSKGYRKLRLWFRHLSPRAKEKARKFWRDHIEGIRQVMELAAQTGEPLSLADIVIDIRDAETGEAMPDAPNIDAEQPCVASGAPFNFTRNDDKGRKFVGCSGCDAEWPEDEIIDGNLPHHAERLRA